eukprot:augustus_masked-scaffold_10-processed-gene-9.37-mRNA-1 protein AED:1.00 eAED:1.00 QI:0/-1/0/0/-1/1/1/0/251
MASPGNRGQEECITRINPFPKVNDILESNLEILYYKRGMGLGLLVVVVSFFGFIIQDVEYINVAGFLHLIPVLMPLCNRVLAAFLWSMISVSSIALTAVSLFINLGSDNAIAGLIIFAIVVVLEGLIIFHLLKLDPNLKERVLVCFADCGCCVKESEVRKEEEKRVATLPYQPASPTPNLPQEEGRNSTNTSDGVGRAAALSIDEIAKMAATPDGAKHMTPAQVAMLAASYQTLSRSSRTLGRSKPPGLDV